jgi:hypothetical protein
MVLRHLLKKLIEVNIQLDFPLFNLVIVVLLDCLEILVDQPFFGEIRNL